jgi:uncharacterized protein involved in outer membrane biogenesis
MSNPEAPLETQKTPRRKGRLVRRWLSRLFLAFVLVSLAAAAGTWAWLESEAGADKLRVWIEEAASAQLDRPVHIADLEVDVVPFRLAVADLAIEGTAPDAPLFLHVDSVDLSVRPWALLSRHLSIQSLVLTNPAAHLEIFPDGSSNAPKGVREDQGGRLEVQIRDLRVSGGRVEVNDRETAVDARLSDVEASMSAPPQLPGAELGPTRGRLQIGAGFLSVGGLAEEPIRLEPLTGVFDVTLGEDRMLIDRLMVVAGNSRIQGAGSIQMWSSVALQVSVGIDLADVNRFWELPGTEDHDGTVTMVASVRWDEDDPGIKAAGTLEGQELRVGGLPIDLLGAGVRFEAGHISIRRRHRGRSRDRPRGRAD